MSDTPFEVLAVKSVEVHPQADRLEIVKVLETQFISRKGDFQPNDLCVYFPPDMLIPEEIGETLGVVNYLKHAVFPGDLRKSKCRIGAIRLRGVVSFGFGISLADISLDIPSVEGTDATEIFGGVKYQPPEKFGLRGDIMRQPAAFHEYTNIQHYYRYAAALVAGMPVRVTEKLHGTNSRVGLVKDDGFEFMCGSHHQRIKFEDAQGRLSLYWKPLSDNMRDMLIFLSTSVNNVLVFGEIYGDKIQQLDYGCPRGKGYRVYDISINGEYLDWKDVKICCEAYGIETVSCLYVGPFSSRIVDEFVSGPTTLADAKDIKCGFKGREGIVITPLKEQPYSEVLNGRLILKAISPDYYVAMNKEIASVTE